MQSLLDMEAADPAERRRATREHTCVPMYMDADTARNVAIADEASTEGLRLLSPVPLRPGLRIRACLRLERQIYLVTGTVRWAARSDRRCFWPWRAGLVLDHPLPFATEDLPRLQF